MRDFLFFFFFLHLSYVLQKKLKFHLNEKENVNFMGNKNSNISFSTFLAISGLIAFEFVNADNEKNPMYMELKRIYVEQVKYLISNLTWSWISTLNKQKGLKFFSSSYP